MIYELRKFKIILFGIIFSSSFLLWGKAHGACSWDGNAGTVASPYDHADVQNCVDDAKLKTGDITINIPTCNVSWDDRVLIDMSSSWANVTGLTIQGAGIGQTIITDTGTSSAFGVVRLFNIVTKTEKIFRLSGMTLNASTTYGIDSTSGLIYVSGNGTQIRIDAITFNLLRGSSNNKDSTGISWHQDTGAYGVIDNCIFNETGTLWQGNGIKVYGAPSGYGEATAFFGRAFTPGTANATYIENNTFTFEYRGNDCYDAYRGARVVVRYNNIHGTASGGHGNDSSGAGESVHTQEVYNNSYDNTCGAASCNAGAKISQAFGWRGGTGVFFNNNIDVNGYSSVSQVGNYRSNYYAEGTATNVTPSSTVLYTSSTGTAAVGNTIYRQGGTDIAYCTITGVVANTSITCSGGLSNSKQWSSGDKFMVFYFPLANTDGGCDGNSPFDGNVSGQEGWICKQQVGSTYDSGYVPKAIYAWGNVYNGATAGHLTLSSGSTRQSSYHVKENQTYFNCDSAADCKTKNDLIDIPGFGYNQGWTYAPYDCPHPLAGTGSCDEGTAGTGGYNITGDDTIAPASPTGLAVS